MNGYLLLADFVALIHASFIAFVVVGFALIIAGAARHWRWTRNFWLRLLHLLAIGFVCAEALAGYICPLTTLEDRLRGLAGGTGYPHDFVGYWIDRLIFFNFPPVVFMTGYLLFGIAVLGVFIWSPPRMRKWNR